MEELMPMIKIVTIVYLGIMLATIKGISDFIGKRKDVPKWFAGVNIAIAVFAACALAIITEYSCFADRHVERCLLWLCMYLGTHFVITMLIGKCKKKH